MQFGFNFAGEPANEDKIIQGNDGFQRMPVEGYRSEEDGLSTRLLAEETRAIVSVRG